MILKCFFFPSRGPNETNDDLLRGMSLLTIRPFGTKLKTVLHFQYIIFTCWQLHTALRTLVSQPTAESSGSQGGRVEREREGGGMDPRLTDLNFLEYDMHPLNHRIFKKRGEGRVW